MRVADKAHPWERVLVIDAGLEEMGILGTQFCCFSTDEKSLFVAMPNGLIEQWDLDNYKKIRSFGKLIAESNHFTGALKIEVNAVGELIVYGRGKFSKYTQVGVLLKELSTNSSKIYSCSPNGVWLAEARDDFKFINLETGETFKIDNKGYSGSIFSKMQWSSDNRFLLFQRRSAFTVIDVESKAIRLNRSNTEQDLNGEGDSQEVKEVRAQDVALIDSKFVDNETKIASIYDGQTMAEGSSSRENVLIFNAAEDGKQLKRIQLEERPRSMWISDNSAEVYVTMVADGRTKLAIFDANKMEQIALVKSKFTNMFPTRAVGLDGKNVAQFSGGAWLQGWDASYLPIRLELLRTKVAQLLPNKDSDLVAITLQNRDTHVWKKRREPSRWGAFVLWEYWTSLLLLTALLLTIMIRICLVAERQGSRKFRRVEWFIVIIATLGLSYEISTLVYKPLIANIWSSTTESVSFRNVLYLILFFACLVGFSMQSEYWRKMLRLVNLIGALRCFFSGSLCRSL